MAFQETTQDGFQELLSYMEEDKPKKTKAAKRPNTLAPKKLTKKSKIELQTAPFITEKAVEKMKEPLLSTPPIQEVLIENSLNAMDEPLTQCVKTTRKFWKFLAGEEPLIPDPIEPKGMLNTFYNSVLNLGQISP